jgi:hypothetical protein
MDRRRTEADRSNAPFAVVAAETIREVLNVRKRRLLLFAEAALPQGQFQAFRKLVLDELGNTGLEQDLLRVVAEMRQKERHGLGGTTHAGKEVPHG